MPTITKCTLKRRRWGQCLVVEVDGRPWAEIDDEVMVCFGLGRGTELTETRLREVEAASRGRIAQRRLVAWLTTRVKSRRQAEEYLRRAGFDEGATHGALAAAERAGLLDDSRFAGALARTRQRAGGVGPRQLRRELAQAGVAPEVAAAATLPLGDAERQRAACRDLLERHARRWRALDDRTRRRRAFALLLRRGFEPDPVRTTIDAHFGASDDDLTTEVAPDSP